MYYVVGATGNDGSCSEPSRPTGNDHVDMSRPVGSAGGSLRAANSEVVLELPAGSLAATTTVRVEEREDERTPSGLIALAGVYEVTPSGPLDAPAKLSVAYRMRVTQFQIAGRLLAAAGLVTKSGASWSEGASETTVTADGYIAGTLSHFSYWTGAAIQPHGTSPAKTDYCSGVCHDLTAAPGSNVRLNARDSAVCYYCHGQGVGLPPAAASGENVQERFGACEGQDAESLGSVHPVAGGDLYCSSCHDPHADPAGSPGLLRAYDAITGRAVSRQNAFCWACHGTVVNRAVEKRVPGYYGRSDGDKKSFFQGTAHDTMETSSSAGVSCLGCHAEHGSGLDSLVREEFVLPGGATMAVSDSGRSLCYGCHTGSSGDDYRGREAFEKSGHAGMAYEAAAFDRTLDFYEGTSEGLRVGAAGTLSVGGIPAVVSADATVYQAFTMAGVYGSPAKLTDGDWGPNVGSTYDPSAVYYSAEGDIDCTFDYVLDLGTEQTISQAIVRSGLDSSKYVAGPGFVTDVAEILVAGDAATWDVASYTSVATSGTLGVGAPREFVIDLTPVTARYVRFRVSKRMSAYEVHWLEELEVMAPVTSGVWTSGERDLSREATAVASGVEWDGEIPPGAEIGVDTDISLDGGTTWTGWQRVASQGAAVPGLVPGADLSGLRVRCRVALDSGAAASAAVLDRVAIWVSTAQSDGRALNVLPGETAEPGMCTQCHDPHGNGNQQYLLAEGPALCLACHDAAGVERPAGYAYQGSSAYALSTHATVACDACHSPHGWPADGDSSVGTERMVRGSRFEACRECHGAGGVGGLDVYAGIEATTNPSGQHSIASGSIVCTDCHGVHAAAFVFPTTRTPFTGEQAISDRPTYTQTVQCVADAEISPRHPDGNKGVDPVLNIGGPDESSVIVRLDPAKLGGPQEDAFGPEEWEMSRATLRMYGTVASAGTLEVWSVPESWVEGTGSSWATNSAAVNGVTYAEREYGAPWSSPEIGVEAWPAITARFDANATPGWIELDVTNALQSAAERSLLIRASGGLELRMESRENGSGHTMNATIDAHMESAVLHPVADTYLVEGSGAPHDESVIKVGHEAEYYPFTYSYLGILNRYPHVYTVTTDMVRFPGLLRRVGLVRFDTSRLVGDPAQVLLNVSSADPPTTKSRFTGGTLESFGYPPVEEWYWSDPTFYTYRPADYWRGDIDIRSVTSPWTDAATWTTTGDSASPFWATAGGDIGPVVAPATGPAAVEQVWRYESIAWSESRDVTDITSKWIDGTVPNYGLAFTRKAAVGAEAWVGAVSLAVTYPDVPARPVNTNDYCLGCHDGTPPAAWASLDTDSSPPDIGWEWTNAWGVHGDAVSETPSGKLKAPYSYGRAALSCSECHDPHGSSNAFHLREEINGRAGMVVADIGGRDQWVQWCGSCHILSSEAEPHPGSAGPEQGCLVYCHKTHSGMHDMSLW